MKNIAAVLALSLFSLPLLADSESDNNTVTATEVLIAESEPGVGQFTTRLLLSKDFLRLDDGRDDGDYTLFERASGEIHSFNHEDKTELVMKRLAVDDIDFKIDFKVDQSAMKEAPKVGGVMPMQFRYYADNRLCKQSVNVQGLLPEVTKALIDYEQALVAQNLQTLNRIPSGVRSACYLANNYQYSSEYLKSGFPLFVMDDLNRQKKLQGFRDVEVPSALFMPMVGYKLYYPNQANLKP